MEKIDETWKDFCASFTWSELLSEFLEGLQHLERYRDSGAALPPHVLAAITMMRAMGQELQGIVNDPGRFSEPASPDAVTKVLALCRKVKRDVPTIGPRGHA